jgi:hypothetical protein
MILKRFRWFLLLALLVPALLAVPARADAVTDSIGVYIGYFGWTEDQYVEKASYTWQQLDDAYGGALDTHEAVYSYYNGSRTYLARGRGFYLRDLLEYAGVDLGSIASIDFFTKDQTVGAYRSFTKGALFDTQRYYFPNLAVNEDTGALYAYDGSGDLWSGASAVEPMLALEDYTEWDAVGSEFEKTADPSLYSTASRFHLFFGQSAPDEIGTSSAAKYVYKILITFAGTPVLSQTETNLELKVGSDHTLAVSVVAEDDLLNDYVKSHITWKSSDESVVKVDGSGRLTVVGPGDAVVTASFGSSSAATNVHVGADETAETTAGTGTGTGNGTGTGAGTGAGTGTGTGVGTVTETETAAPASSSAGETAASSSAQEPIGKDETSSADETKRGVYLLAPSALSGSAQAGQTGGEAMGEGSRQLVLQTPETRSYALPAAVCLCLAAALGFLFGVIRYKKQR